MSQFLKLDAKAPHLLEYFSAIAAEPWAMLLDSAASSHVNSRFDILVARPVATLVFQQGELTQTEQGQSQLLQMDPFGALQHLISSYFPDKPECSDNTELPFVGGALGYFSYDLGTVIEPVPQAADAGALLPDMAVGIYLWALILDKQQQQLWYVDYRGDAQKHWVDTSVLFTPTTETSAFRLTSNWQANMDKASYSQKFDQVQNYLQSGDCYQINLAQRFAASYSGDEWQAYLTLRSKNAAPFSAFLRLPQGAVLSLSPERFLQLKAGQVETKPIKGTRPRFADPALDKQSAEELQAAPKDRAENVMIVDLLRNDLGKHCVPGTVKVPALFAIESFPAVHHLVSTITGTLNPSADACDLLRGAFPGGSITGAPKVRAMQIIAELEPHSRSVYCGAVGYINSSGDMDTNIAIRTLVMAQGQAFCWAGGGIVADSQVDAEYEETFHKVNKILPLLGTIECPPLAAKAMET
ncbi:aminodeoxychorismate synthase component I [Rheinheimera sp. 1928-s]|uniref:aminodeoxychorismate synthase component I n=1 Tax=Rheinheimera sp. 1928-s TaxID=3033803 RepID=UPI002620DD2C|nr:aminodeoxychorismate synthase component I [Rheinheimera sp. 1928-s]MDF3126041.1 aminodeoxychorismate synthase component I [Rheinheimera sp. 1928-s]